MILRTGVFASAEHVEEARRRSRAVRETPVMCVGGVWLHEHESEIFKKWLDDLAQAYGLPEPGRVDGEVNHYGMTSRGEFNRYAPD
jgi:hypothetical protein